MMRARWVGVLCGAMLLLGACGRGPAGDGEPTVATATVPPASASPAAEASPAAPTAAPAPATPAPAPGGQATEVAGYGFAAPEGYTLVALPAEVETLLAQRQEAAGVEVSDLAATGLVSVSTGQPVIVLVTRYAGMDVTTAEFDAQRRAMAASQGVELTPETLGGTPVLVGGAPLPLVSWTEGADTLVMVTTQGGVTLDELRTIATAMLQSG
jgi:hypothetical protein